MDILKTNFIAKKPEIFLCTLTHDGRLDAGMSMIFNAGASNQLYTAKSVPTSLLAFACNRMWCEAMNDGYKWFAMLHADIIPELGFVDKLIALAEEHGADVMSAVVPIKGPDGITSTAISGENDFNRFTRLTTKLIYDPRFPPVFDVQEACTALANMGYNSIPGDPGDVMPYGWKPRLLVNTGCMVARLDRDWCSKVHFTINDRIVQGTNGSLAAEVESEDWFFSRRVAEEGGKVMATTLVKLQHISYSYAYHSHHIWGHDVDQEGYLQR